MPIQLKGFILYFFQAIKQSITYYYILLLLPPCSHPLTSLSLPPELNKISSSTKKLH